MNCREWTFKQKNRETGVERTMSVAQYFQERYGLVLNYPTLPVVETAKKGVAFPMECCTILEGQKYPYKLDEIMVNDISTEILSRPSCANTNASDCLHDQVCGDQACRTP